MNTHQTKPKYPRIAIALVGGVAGVLALSLAFNIHRLVSPKDSPVHQAETALKEAPASEASLSAPIKAEVDKAPQESRTALNTVYEAFSFAPLWTSSKNQSRLQSLTKSMYEARDQGIERENLVRLVAKVKTKLSPDEAAQTDVALTREALSLANALRLGAVSTAELGTSWVMPAETFDAAPVLIDGLKRGDIQGIFAKLPPADEQYKGLVTALQIYRDMATQGGWPTLPAGEELRLDTQDARIAIINARLKAEGYLDARETPDAARLAEAVMTFQKRNGLEPDGRLGKETLATLNISADDRVAQIAANLERRRHTVRDLGDDHIAVNSASTMLTLYRNAKPELTLKVVSGKPVHATPILSAKITAVTLNPRWEIPPSIAGKEILLKLKANPNYFADNNMVVVDGPEADPHGQSIDWSQYSAKSLPVRFRQRAGDDNALGYIKFQMTNPQNIYLHDTPSRKAFAKYERHLSHGCIRVDQPATLAQQVLADTTGWDASEVEKEIATNGTRSIVLKKPLPVYIFYWTALVEKDGVYFPQDVYSRDKALAAALGIKPALEEKQHPDRLVALD